MLYILENTNTSLLQVPYYVAELTEKIAEYDRIQITKASQTKLKVLLFCAKLIVLSLLEIKQLEPLGIQCSLIVVVCLVFCSMLSFL